MHGLFLNMKTIRCLFFVIFVSNLIYWVICFGSNLKSKKQSQNFQKTILTFLGFFIMKIPSKTHPNPRPFWGCWGFASHAQTAPTNSPNMMNRHQKPWGDLSFPMFWDTEIPQNSWWFGGFDSALESYPSGKGMDLLLHLHQCLALYPTVTIRNPSSCHSISMRSFHFLDFFVFNLANPLS